MTRLFSRTMLGLAFIAAGINHFLQPRLYESIMPDYLPRHKELVAISGYAEVALGATLLVPRWRLPARWGLTALLIAIFPANLHMALHPDRYSQIPRVLLWLRLPLQGILIAWVWWLTADTKKRSQEY